MPYVGMSKIRVYILDFPVCTFPAIIFQKKRKKNKDFFVGVVLEGLTAEDGIC